jgi:hypothetical protein
MFAAIPVPETWRPFISATGRGSEFMTRRRRRDPNGKYVIPCKGLDRGKNRSCDQDCCCGRDNFFIMSYISGLIQEDPFDTRSDGNFAFSWDRANGENVG